MNVLNLAIAEFCPNLKSLFIQFRNNNEMKTLKEIFNGCQQLKSFITSYYLQEGKKLLEIIAKYSPKNFHELTLHNHVKLSSNDLKSFFINWKKITFFYS